MSNKRKFMQNESMMYNSSNKMKYEDEKSMLDDMNSRRIPILSGNIASNLFISQPPMNSNQSISYNTMLFAQQQQSQNSGRQYNQVNNQQQGRTLNDFLIQFISLCAQFGFQCPIDIASATINFLMHSLQQQMKNGMNNSSIFSIQDTSQSALQGDSSVFGYGYVLMVSNLNEEKVTPDALFTLFGVYGDVNRVKIMFNKKDTALIQFATSEQAQVAMKYLNGEELFGKQMFIQLSKSGIVQMPKAGTTGDLTKDYMGSKLHRFRKPNSKNYLNIFAPNNVLHLSNIPENIDDVTIRNFFHQYNFRALKIRFMLKEKKMALVELEDTDTAMQALIALHNSQISENCHLRISFSKSGI